MAYSASVIYDTRVNSKAWSAYRVSVAEIAKPLRPLEKEGPVYNDTVYYRGVFSTLAEAVAALSETGQVEA